MTDFADFGEDSRGALAWVELSLVEYVIYFFYFFYFRLA